MITLCGFAISNYFNIVKMALIEKGLPFEEERVLPASTDEAVLAISPLGKIPFIRTPQGGMCESNAILEYINASAASPALLPEDAFAAAKVRELITYINLHLELVARELYAQAFFGGTVSEATQERVRKQLAKNINGFKRLVQFGPYIAGGTFTIARSRNGHTRCVRRRHVIGCGCGLQALREAGGRACQRTKSGGRPKSGYLTSHQHRYGRLRHHFVGHAAQHKPSNARAAMRTQHNQIGTFQRCHLNNAAGGGDVFHKSDLQLHRRSTGLA
jgi:glutathione S-transferase